MNPEPATDLLNGLICLAPFCLGALGLVAFAALLVWIIYRQWQPKSTAALAAGSEAMRSKLEQMVASLRPWSSEGLTDLSTDWDARWTRFGRDLSASGSIPSLSAPKGPGWVALALKVRGARQPEGQMQARTTAQAFDYRLSRFFRIIVRINIVIV